MGRELVPQHTAKDLGVILDTNLTYDQHIYQNYLPLYVLSQSNKVHKACFWQTHPTNYYKCFSLWYLLLKLQPVCTNMITSHQF